MRRGGIRWALVLRRCGAFFLATLGAALLLSGAGGQASGALRALGDNPAFLSAVLRGELGRVEKALSALEGVSAVEMNLEGKSATVTLSAEVSDEVLTKAVTDAGYEVLSIQ